jgi:aspartate ammonia-lyase
MSPQEVLTPPATATTATRTEKDSLGYREVPADAYYGIQALRGCENFPISGIRMAQVIPMLPKAFGWIKKATAQTNMELGLLDKHNPTNNTAIGKALMDACDEMIAGKFDSEFIVDAYQGGTGTSNHMNANEILANRATELLGGKKGEYKVHPNDHANYGQSTNDITPTVMRLTILAMHPDLVTCLTGFAKALRAKSQAFASILIPGRTHMQDAVPLTMGQVFGAYAQSIEDTLEQVLFSVHKLHHIGLGASALGTGLNTHPQYRAVVTKNLSSISGLPLQQTADYFQATSSFASFASYSSALRNVALELEKIAQDLKLYSCGPKTGIAEIKLPDLQPGSSIMPGKVNPVMPELMDQLSYAVQANDLAVALCAQNGQWQLNVMMPLTLLKITESMRLLTNGINVFVSTCINGLETNTDQCQHRLEHSTILLTALNPYIGYDNAAKIAKKIVAEDKTVRQIVLEEAMTDNQGQLLTEARLDAILSVEAMTQPPKA